MGGDGRTTGRPDGPRRRWPSGFVGMLAAVLAAEVALSGLVRFESMAMAEWRTGRASAAGRDATSAEILCLGDSLVKTGVVPAALEARLDRTAYNLAGYANPTPATYSLFRRALTAGARPRAIVLDAHEALLAAGDYRGCVAAWAGLLGPNEALRLALDDGDPGFFGLYLVHHLVPSVRLRQDLRAAVVGLFVGPDAQGPTHWPRVLDRQRRRNSGALLFPPAEPDSTRVAVPPAEDTGAGPIASRTNLLYLGRILDLARARGILVFLVAPPVRPGSDRIGQEERHIDLLRALGQCHENVVFLDGRRAVAEGDVFFDACHMDYRGATDFSQALAEVMAPWLLGPAPAGRHLTLLPGPRASTRLAVETLDESRWAVAWRTGTARPARAE